MLDGHLYIGYTLNLLICMISKQWLATCSNRRAFNALAAPLVADLN